MQAGLSVRSSMNKIAADYLQIKGRKEKWERPVYEEVQRLCKEIQGGVPEAEAYEKFGKRCKIAEYRILSVLLVQNLKKGSQDILLFLEREAAFALENRKRVMKVKGEQASTKLVFPMMIQLMLIFGVLMVPAFLSFVS